MARSARATSGISAEYRSLDGLSPRIEPTPQLADVGTGTVDEQGGIEASGLRQAGRIAATAGVAVTLLLSISVLNLPAAQPGVLPPPAGVASGSFTGAPASATLATHAAISPRSGAG